MSTSTRSERRAEAKTWDDHSWVATHETFEAAEPHASAPLGWCERCAGTEPLEDDEDAS